MKKGLLLLLSLLCLVFVLSSCGECEHKEYDEGVVTTAATCSTDGVMTYTCKKCGETKTEAIPKNDAHTYGTLVAAVDATCTEAGTVAHYQCSGCQKLFDADKNAITSIEVPAKGHTMTFTAEQKATCTEAGTKAFYTCSVCNKEYADEAGTTLIGDKNVDATGHNAVLVAEVPATCGKAGVAAHYQCTNCQKFFTTAAATTEASAEDFAIPTLGHTFVYDAVNNTSKWTFDANKQQFSVKCLVCGQTTQTATIKNGATNDTIAMGNTDPVVIVTGDGLATNDKTNYTITINAPVSGIYQLNFYRNIDTAAAYNGNFFVRNTTLETIKAGLADELYVQCNWSADAADGNGVKDTTSNVISIYLQKGENVLNLTQYTSGSKIVDLNKVEARLVFEGNVVDVAQSLDASSTNGWGGNSNDSNLGGHCVSTSFKGLKRMWAPRGGNTMIYKDKLVVDNEGVYALVIAIHGSTYSGKAQITLTDENDKVVYDSGAYIVVKADENDNYFKTVNRGHVADSTNGTDLYNHIDYVELAAGSYTVKITQLSGSTYFECGSTMLLDVDKDLGADACNHRMSLPVTVPATCEENGSITYTCLDCGTKFVSVINALEHNFVAPSIESQPAAWLLAGTQIETCTKCGAEREVEHAHKFTAPVVVASSCDVAGQAISYCEYCQKKEVTEVPVVGHIFGDAVVENGNVVRCCTRANCGARMDIELFKGKEIGDYADSTFAATSFATYQDLFVNAEESGVYILRFAYHFENPEDEGAYGAAYVLNKTHPEALANCWIDTDNQNDFEESYAFWTYLEKGLNEIRLSFTKSSKFSLTGISAEFAKPVTNPVYFTEHVTYDPNGDVKNANAQIGIGGINTGWYHIMDGNTYNPTKATSGDELHIKQNYTITETGFYEVSTVAYGTNGAELRFDFKKDGIIVASTITDSMQSHGVKGSFANKGYIPAEGVGNHGYCAPFHFEDTTYVCVNNEADKTQTAIFLEAGEYEVICTGTIKGNQWASATVGFIGLTAVEAKKDAEGNELVHYEGTAPTCNTPGSAEYWKNEETGKMYVFNAEQQLVEVSAEDLALPIAHKLTKHDKVDATCTEKGTELYYECSACGKLFSDEEYTEIAAPAEINLKDHTFGESVVTKIATCTEKAVSTKICSACGYTENTVGDALGHTYVVVEALGSAATCSVAGKKAEVCEVCGDIKYTEIDTVAHTLSHSAAVAHKYEGGVEIAGQVEYWVCSVCTKMFTDADATTEITDTQELTHNYEEDLTKRVEATCTATGTMVSKCTICGIEKSEPITMKDHNWNNGVVKTGATCTTNGVTTKTCTVCGLTDDVVEEALGHALALHNKIDATCTQTGINAIWKCTRCTYIVKDNNGVATETETTEAAETIQELGHDEQTVHTTLPTCTTEGLDTITCKRCSISYTKVVPKLAGDDGVPGTHKWDAGTVTTAATCTTKGVRTYKCTYEGCTGTKTADISMVPHVEDNGTITTPATCTTKGVMTFKCKNCLTFEMRTAEVEIDTNAHEFDAADIVVKIDEATCTVDAQIVGFCKLCGDPTNKTLVTKIIKKSEGHKLGELVPAAGLCGTRTCSVCGEVVVSAHDAEHLVYHAAVAPTCTTKGSIEYYECLTCGNYYADNKGLDQITDGVEVDMLPHAFKSLANMMLSGMTGSGLHFVCKDCGADFDATTDKEVTINTNDGFAQRWVLQFAVYATEAGFYRFTPVVENVSDVGILRLMNYDGKGNTNGGAKDKHAGGFIDKIGDPQKLSSCDIYLNVGWNTLQLNNTTNGSSNKQDVAINYKSIKFTKVSSENTVGGIYVVQGSSNNPSVQFQGSFTQYLTNDYAACGLNTKSNFQYGIYQDLVITEEGDYTFGQALVGRSIDSVIILEKDGIEVKAVAKEADIRKVTPGLGGSLTAEETNLYFGHYQRPHVYRELYSTVHLEAGTYHVKHTAENITVGSNLGSSGNWWPILYCSGAITVIKVDSQVK